MHTETERILGTLQVIVEPYLTVDLPDHENSGTIVPFVWDVSEQGEFNVFNLCLANGWLQLTDVDKRIRSGQKMEYAKWFYDFFLGVEEENLRKNKLEEVFAKYQQVNKFFNQTFPEVIMYRFSFFTQEHIYIIGESNPGDWVGLYIESEFVYI